MKKATVKEVIELRYFVILKTGYGKWCVHFWMGERKSHGLQVSKYFETKEEAKGHADELAKYMLPLFDAYKTITNKPQ